MARNRYLTLIGVVLALGGCSDAAPQILEVRPVRTLTVEPQPLEDDHRLIGEVRPRHESEFGFRVAGKIVSRTAEIGHVVRKGDILARLDDQEYRIKLRAAEAELVSAQAVLIEAQSAEERQRQLLAGGVTTRANHDAALKNLRSAEAKRDAAKASLESAKDQLSYCDLRAEFDGIVTGVGAEAGQVVSSGKMIVKVAQAAAKDAVFSVAEAVFGNQALNNKPPKVIVSLLSEPSVFAEGTVREVSPIADPTTRTYQVKVTLDDAPEQMRFGSSIAVRPKTTGSPVVILPSGALFDRSGLPAVWVVQPHDHSLALKPVTINRFETDRVIVGAGLAKGDVVVTAGANRLREHQTVRLAHGGGQ